MQPILNFQGVNINNNQNLFQSGESVNPLDSIKTTVTKNLPKNLNPPNSSNQIRNMTKNNNNLFISPINKIPNHKKKNINPMEDPKYSQNFKSNFMMPQNNPNSNFMFNQNTFPKNSMNNMNPNQFSLNSNINKKQSLMNQQKMLNQQIMNQNMIQQQIMKQNMEKQIQQQMIQNQIIQQQMINRQLGQQQMLLKMSQNSINSQIQNNFEVIIFFKVREEEYDKDLIGIPIQLNEKVSYLIEKYRNKTGDFEPKKKFIFNAKELNSNLSCNENGLCANSIIQVINTRNVMGANYNY